MYLSNERAEVDNMNLSADLQVKLEFDEKYKNLRRLLVKKDIEIQKLKDKVNEFIRIRNISSKPKDIYDDKYVNGNLIRLPYILTYYLTYTIKAD